MKEITKRRLTWRKIGAMIKPVIKENSIRKRQLDKPSLKWKDFVKRDIKVVRLRVN